jgi:xylan 1,4-beta-xylosidase
LKGVDERLRVGGPATAAADWVDAFVAHVASANVPADFVSSHGYADDTVEHLFHTNEAIPVDERVCRAVKKVHDQIAASARPKLPLLWTEWNVASFGALHARDTTFVGPALAQDVHDCDGLAEMMAWWTFDDVFEEHGVVKEPFHGGFGLIAAGGIKKPSYNAFALLHRLGHERLESEAKNAIITRRPDGTLVIAAWNLVDLDQKGAAREIRFEFRGAATPPRVLVSRLDEQHGNTLRAYEAMARPRYPTRVQIEKMKQAAELGRPEELQGEGGGVDIEIPVNGLVLMEVPQAQGPKESNHK